MHVEKKAAMQRSWRRALQAEKTPETKVLQNATGMSWSKDREKSLWLDSSEPGREGCEVEGREAGARAQRVFWATARNLSYTQIVPESH